MGIKEDHAASAAVSVGEVLIYELVKCGYSRCGLEKK
jgi:hypothetical protein